MVITVDVPVVLCLLDVPVVPVVDVLVVPVVPPVLDLVLVVDSTTLLLDTAELSSYISSLLPAPQYSYWLPGQTKLQSVNAARTDPALITLPQ